MHIFGLHVMVSLIAYHCPSVCQYSIKQRKPVTQEIGQSIVEYPNTNRMYVVQETVSKRLMLAERIWYPDNTTKVWERFHLLLESDLRVSARHLSRVASHFD